MKLRGSEKNKFIFLIFILLIIFILFACFLTLIININYNKGIIPIIYFLLMIYSIIIFLYYLFYTYPTNDFQKRKVTLKIPYLIFFIINLFLFVLSSVILWI